MDQEFGQNIVSLCCMITEVSTDVEFETPILWPSDAKSCLIWKDPDYEKEWRQEGKGTTEDEMVGWHHRLNGHEFGWTPGVGDGQGSLACCSPWGLKESDMTEWLNWTELNWVEMVKQQNWGHMSGASFLGGCCISWFFSISHLLNLECSRWLLPQVLLLGLGWLEQMGKPMYLSLT